MNVQQNLVIIKELDVMSVRIVLDGTLTLSFGFSWTMHLMLVFIRNVMSSRLHGKVRCTYRKVKMRCWGWAMPVTKVCLQNVWRKLDCRALLYIRSECFQSTKKCSCVLNDGKFTNSTRLGATWTRMLGKAGLQRVCVLKRAVFK